MAEPFTIYKLTILYMLNKAGFPLSNTQISNFFLDQEYTDYFRVQEVLGDLVDTELIQARSTHSNTQYSITAAGKETLHIVLQTGAEIKKIINSRAGLQYKLCHLIYGA